MITRNVLTAIAVMAQLLFGQADLRSGVSEPRDQAGGRISSRGRGECSSSLICGSPCEGCSARRSWWKIVPALERRLPRDWSPAHPRMGTQSSSVLQIWSPISLGLKEPGYKQEDFVLVGGINYLPNVLIVNTASSKAKTLQKLVEFGKAHQGVLTFGTNGPQSSPNLMSRRFDALSKIGWREVPLQRSSPGHARHAGRPD